MLETQSRICGNRMKVGDLIQFKQNGEIMICLKINGEGGWSNYSYVQVIAMGYGGVICRSAASNFIVIETKIMEQ